MTIKIRMLALAIAGALSLAPTLAGAQSNPGQPAAGAIAIGQGAGLPIWTVPSGDCTLSSGGTIFCTNTNTIDNYGASPANSGAANLTAIQAAINATPAGGKVLVPHAGYTISGTLNITASITFECLALAPNGNIIQTSLTATTISADANQFTIRNCNFVGSGAGTSRVGIAVGDNGRTVTCSVATTTLTCPSGNFTSADVGAGISIGATGLLSFMQSVTNATTAVLTVGGTATSQSTLIAQVYQDWTIDNVVLNNFFLPLHVINGSRYHVDKLYTVANGNAGATGILQESQVSPDNFDYFISNSVFYTADNAAGRGIEIRSGGGAHITNSKTLGGQYGFFFNWNTAGSGLVSISNTSFENCTTNALLFTTAAAFNSVILTGNHMDCGSSAVIEFAAGATVISDVSISNNIIATGATPALKLAQVNFLNATGNTILTVLGNPTISILSTCTNCTFSANNIIGATKTYASASATAVIDDMIGSIFANLPALAANGTRVFVTDGAPNSSPCTASSTGALAIRQNGAWVCGAAIANPLPVASGGTGSTSLTAHNIPVGNGTGALGLVATGATGTVLRGQTGADPVFGAVNLPTDVTGVLPLTSLPVHSSFSANKNGVDQTGIATATYTQVTFGTAAYNVNGNFSSNLWTPPAGKIHLDSSVDISGTWAGGALDAIAVYKNGALLKNRYIYSITGGANNLMISLDDVASGSDTYGVYAYMTLSSGTGTVTGNSQVTWFNGHWIAP